MRKAIITLTDGRTYEYENQYIWSYVEQLNDDRTPFIEIGNFVFKKNEISVIQIVDLKEEDKKESELFKSNE